MTAPSTGQPAPDPQAGIERLERFLAASSERLQAQKAAEAFADRMPNLTSSERQQLISLYADERLADDKRRRSQRARLEVAHEARERLRARCIRVALLLGVCSTVLTLCLIVHTLR
ncbi:hypothetical protein [Streptomyces sp. NBC_00467]|uniref:hypothetical protein n=1 Tax=Streptomyces sp. NBC_00467 TaxID=2975752 RepID=UPI002E197D19